MTGKEIQASFLEKRHAGLVHVTSSEMVFVDTIRGSTAS